MSRLVQVWDGVFTKLEMENPGGSHKFRAANHILERAISLGELTAGRSTVIEKTGGNFGLALLALCQKRDISVELVVGLQFSPVKRRLLEALGAKLLGLELLQSGWTPAEVVNHYLGCQTSNGRSYWYPDQFNNLTGISAHRFETASELAQQLTAAGSGKNIIFVGGAGTGASFTGLTLGLRDHGFDVYAVLAEPEGCCSSEGVFIDHRFEGVAVGVVPPFLDLSLVKRRINVPLLEAFETQRAVYKEIGLWIGHSSAMCLAVAKRLKADDRNTATPIVTITYDSGLWYPDYAS